MGSLAVGSLLDFSHLTRRTRALGGIAGLFVLTMALWGGGLSIQLTYTRESATAASESSKLDWVSNGYGKYLTLYLFYGFFDSVWQT